MEQAPDDDLPPLISDERTTFRGNFASEGPGAKELSKENVYKAIGDGWEKGRKLGKVFFEETSTDEAATTLFTARFVLVGGHGFTVEGVIPGEGSWVGSGNALVSARSDRYKELPPDIPVEGRNPKRWG